MIDNGRSFAVASDESLVDLITRAQQRLVVVCPALSDAVAQALAERLGDEGHIDMMVILDADPEVYRLGYGTEAALSKLRTAAKEKHFGLRIQHGVRIGLVISDDVMMVFSPVPKLVEAGSNSTEKPNAILISGDVSNRLAKATGIAASDKGAGQEIVRQGS